MKDPAPLLHLATTAEWRAHLAAGVIAPPSLREVGFVHLSTPEQVRLPATRLYAGRPDVSLLVLDPDRLGVEVRHEPGVPGDPESMRFPHAYGPVPTAAVLAVLPYRPRPDGAFDAPHLPVTDAMARYRAFEPSMLRRAATREVPVAGGVGVLTESVAASFQHNQLIVDAPVDAQQVVAEADRVLGGAGFGHRTAMLVGEHLAGAAAALTAHGWTVQPLVGMAAPAGGPPVAGVEAYGAAGSPALRQAWARHWLHELPDLSDAEIGQFVDRYRVEAEVLELTHLAVLDPTVPDGIVAWCVLRIDGATAQVDALNTVPGHRGRGHGDALLAEARSRAGAAGCDLVVLDARIDDWPRHWYARRGFTEVARSWTAGRTGVASARQWQRWTSPL